MVRKKSHGVFQCFKTTPNSWKSSFKPVFVVPDFFFELFGDHQNPLKQPAPTHIHHTTILRVSVKFYKKSEMFQKLVGMIFRGVAVVWSAQTCSYAFLTSL